MKQTIGVVGLWHLGETYAACLADLGHTVIGFSSDSDLIDSFRKSVPPLAEPGLPELLAKYQTSGSLSFTSDRAALNQCTVVWFTEDVPTNEHNEADVSGLLETIRSIAPHLRDGVTIAVSSQIPVGTSMRITEALKEIRPELSFSYFYSPENLRLGDAIRCFMDPKRVVVGADTQATHELAASIFAPLNAAIIAMSPASAEMAKHAMNAWLATSIGFTNDLADVCERTGADIEDVIRALKSEPRVGDKAYLFAGLGFSGWTIARDLRSLMSVSGGASLPVIEGAYRKNESRGEIVLARMRSRFGDLRGKTFAIFGLTYKAGTPTLKNSQALEIERSLREAGANTRLYDPLADAADVASHTPSPFSRDAYEAATGADGILVLVADRGLESLDFGRLFGVLKTAYLFDGQNILTSKEGEMRERGIEYERIGRG